jgi:hypothetical protein
MRLLGNQWKPNASQTAISAGGGRRWQQGGQRKDLLGESMSAVLKEGSNSKASHNISNNIAETNSASLGDVVPAQIDTGEGRQAVYPVCASPNQTDEDFTDDDDDDDDDPGVARVSTGHGSAVESGKSFWLNLLSDQLDEQSIAADDHDNDDDDDDDNDNDIPSKDKEQVNAPSMLARKSILGREIQLVWSNGSPLSESSAFDSSIQANTLTSPSSFNENTEKRPILSRSQRFSKIQQWEDRLQNLRRIENTARGKSEPKEILNNLEVPKQSNKKPTTPRRSFGDVTNRVDTLPSTTLLMMSDEVISDFRSDMRSSWRNHPIAAAKKTVQLNMKSKPESNGTTPVRHCKTTKTTLSSSTSMERAMPTTIAPTLYGSSTPLKITPVPTSSFAQKLKRQSKLEKVGPKLDDQRRFQWAYNAWQTAGLMKKVNFPSTMAGQSNGVDEPSHQEYATDFDEGVTATEEANSDVTSEGQSTSQEQNFPEEGIDPAPSTDSDHSTGFRNLLNLWRDQSKSQLLAPFVSDRDGDKSNDSSSFDDHEEMGAASNNVTADLTGKFLVSQSSMDAFASESIARLEDKNISPDKMDSRFQEDSAISGTSSELVPPNSNQHATPGPYRMKPEAIFADSDLFEEKNLSNEGESSRALIILQDGNRYQVLVGETEHVSGDAMVIRKLGNVVGSHEQQIMDYEQGEYSRSIFSDNEDLISFFLPQMGMASACLVNPDDPTAIENVLRPWQVEFLKSFGIYSGDQLVKARHRSADILARALRQWRKKHDMIPFKTTSCGMAIHIWAKTCKAYVRSIRKQILSGSNLLERQPEAVMTELSFFLDALPAAPKRKEVPSLCSIEVESQMEV